MVSDHDNESRGPPARAAPFRRAYAEALLSGVPHAAEAVIREAIEAGLEEAVLDEHVIRPALDLVGELWADGRLSIAEEHLATATSLRVLTLQREAFRIARQRASWRVLLAGAQRELHVVGLEMAGSLIVHAGYDVRLYGADLPAADIAAAAAEHRPAVVGLTTATALSAATLPATFAAIRRASPDTGIVVGGRAADEAWGARFGITVCRHVTDAVGQVDAYVRRAGHN